MSAWAPEDVGWNAEAVDEALVALARAAGLEPRPVAPPNTRLRDDLQDPRTRDRWFEAVAHHVGIEAEPIECNYGELDRTLASLGPALVRVPAPDGFRYLAVISARRGSLLVIAPSLARRRVPSAEVSRALTARVVQDFSPRVDAWLAVARVGARKVARARAELLKHFLSDVRVGEIWLLRADPGSSFWKDLRRKGALRRAGWFGLASLAQVVASLCGWALIGRASISGLVDPGWLVTWTLVSLTAVALQLASARLGGRLAIDVAGVLKQRLLAGALRLDPDSIRAEGSGRLLAMVSESSAIETAGLGGALGGAVALVQLCSAAVVLALGAGGPLHAALLIVWSGVIAVFAARFYVRRAAWTSERLALTNVFVENVVGNRTRVAQQPETDWHRIEDGMVSHHLASSEAMDASSTHLSALPSRGWLLLGLLGLIPAILGHTDTTRLAISIGGILQAQAALSALILSATAILGAHVAWRSIGRLFRAAAAMPAPGLPDVPLERAEPAGNATVLLDAQGVSFRHRPTGEAVLRDCSLTVREGDRVLLEGRSGGGKSTLASLLVGQRAPESGHILLRGLDVAALGARAWRERVASAPQFHENHILSATLAFNLLMGRSWPATLADRREAEDVCRELGLGGLLDRMPAGLDQVVGETGWQLSHGERSRIFLARALLQRADLVILDETFAAIDPLTLRSCVETACARAPALVVIAHP